MANNLPTTADPWNALRSATPARIALGRSGGSLPTAEWLAFKSAHAAARDAVQHPFDTTALADAIAALGLATIIVSTRAADRATYLQRPDLGRRLTPPSRERLQQQATSAAHEPDLAIVVSDGLSALAVQRNAAGLLARLTPWLVSAGWRLAPVAIAPLGRVALQDEVGELLSAQMALILIGERPGLGSPDSLGAYLVFQPRVGNTDAQRNCVSNIRPEGMSYAAAAETLRYLLNEVRRRQTSGVALKDERPSHPGDDLAPQRAPTELETAPTVPGRG